MQFDRIGRYRLDRPLGSGAFGVVWLAHDESLDAPVAVKVMAENWAFRLDLRERFLAEARMLRRAASDRVVQVYDIGELPDERPYFVMEYAGGGTLADRLAQAGGRLPLGEALHMAAETARGVAALHRAGIVHRDVKPSNVLVQHAPDGRERVLVADLGLAKSLAQASGLTLTAGSAGYMAPEQADPDEDGIDERADVYGLGALAYHLLTGRVPAAPGKVQPPAAYRPDLPEDVQRTVLRALAPDREERWPGALDFAGQLDALAARYARSAPPPGAAAPVEPATVTVPRPAHSAPPPARRRRVPLWSALAVAAVAGLGAGAAALYGHSNAGPAAGASAASSTRPTTAAPATPTPAAGPHGAATTPAAGCGTPRPVKAIPAGYRKARYLGISLAVPDGWTARERSDGQQVDFIDPTDRVVLRLGRNEFGGTDPVRGWEDLEKDVSRKLTGYQRARLNPTCYQGRQAALWEFTWQASVPYRAVDLGWSDPQLNAYAVYLSAPAAQWKTYQPVFDTAVGTLTAG